MDDEKLAERLSATAIGEKTKLQELVSLVKHADDKFPRFNLLKREDGMVRIELALAGYESHEIKVESFPDRLVVSSDGRESDFANDDAEYYCAHRGIAARSFKKVFPVAGEYSVQEVSFRNGILRIDVYRQFQEAEPIVHEIQEV